jgi:hypothetical protein
VKGGGKLHHENGKETGGVAQEWECLLCKHEVLNSNPSLTKKKKKVKIEPQIKQE